MFGSSDLNGEKSAGQANDPVIYSDFDGTIALADATDAILNQFADPSWREIEDEWVLGRIGSRECLRRQMALVRASAQDLNALIDSIPLDPHFAAFYRQARARAVPFYVVSDGFDYVISRILHKAACAGGVNGEASELASDLHLYSSSMRVEGRTLRVDFPFWPAPCVHGCATCKPEVIRRTRGNHSPVIFIGDGLSDRFAVEEADLVFGKDKLLAYCRDRGLACRPFSSFADIARDLGPLWSDRGLAARVPINSANLSF